MSLKSKETQTGLQLIVCTVPENTPTKIFSYDTKGKERKKTNISRMFKLTDKTSLCHLLHLVI